eukprot:429206_1
MSTKNNALLKVGLLGDGKVGKTTLINRYIYNKYGDDYNVAQQIQNSRKIIQFKNHKLILSIYDLPAIPFIDDASINTISVGAGVLLFVFDLMQQQSLFSIKKWFKDAKANNKDFVSILVGTKYDLFTELDDYNKQRMTEQARKIAKSMRAPLIYCSAAESINVKKIFKLIISNVFDLKSKIKPAHDPTKHAIIEFEEGNDHKKKTRVILLHHVDDNEFNDALDNKPEMTESDEEILIEEKVDWKVFGNNTQNCNPKKRKNIVKNCDCLRRIAHGLKYYTSSINDKSYNEEKDKFINFCHNGYKHCIDDYVHFMTV